jgi:hypothetical protein
MTAPVALYPDSLLAQLFMATTYPDDFAAAAAWSKSHPNDKGDAAVKLVENQPWDPSVASLVAFPEVLITFGDKPDWVRNMGDAFLAQPEDVMNAVQRLRQKAQQAGNLKSNEEIKVSTQKPEAPVTTIVQQSAPPAQVIVIEPAQPSVVYVPAYNPAYVYGPWPYPAYPPYYYPPPPGYWFSRTIATGIAWGIGIGISNALWGGCNWGHGSVNVNVNRYNNINVNRQINANGNRSTGTTTPSVVAIRRTAGGTRPVRTSTRSTSQATGNSIEARTQGVTRRATPAESAPRRRCRTAALPPTPDRPVTVPKAWIAVRCNKACKTWIAGQDSSVHRLHPETTRWPAPATGRPASRWIGARPANRWRARRQLPVPPRRAVAREPVAVAVAAHGLEEAEAEAGLVVVAVAGNRRNRT